MATVINQSQRCSALQRSWKVDVNELSPQTQKFLLKNQKHVKPLPDGCVWEEKRYRSVSRKSNQIGPVRSVSSMSRYATLPLPMQHLTFTNSTEICEKDLNEENQQDDIIRNEESFVRSLPKNSGRFSGRDPYGSARKKETSRYYSIINSNEQEKRINEKLKPKILSEEDRKELAIKPIQNVIPEPSPKGCRAARSYNALQILEPFEQPTPTFHSNDVQECIKRYPIIQIVPEVSDDEDQ